MECGRSNQESRSQLSRRKGKYRGFFDTGVLVGPATLVKRVHFYNLELLNQFTLHPYPIPSSFILTEMTCGINNTCQHLAMTAT